MAQILFARRAPRRVLAGAILLTLAAAGFAQTTLTWGPNGSGLPAGGSGTWSTSAANWTANNGATYIAWPNPGSPNADPNGFGNPAEFSGTAGTVTLATAISTSGLVFDTSNYSINGAGNTLTLQNPLGFSALVRTPVSGGTATINANIAGSQGVTVIGNGGTVILSGNHTFTSDLTIKDGATVKVLAASSSFDSSNSLSLGFNSGYGFGGGGTFIFDNTGATGAVSQSFLGQFGSGIKASAGDSTVQTNRVAAQNVTLDLSLYAFSRSAGATVNFVVNGGTNGVNNKIAFTSVSQSFGFQDQATFFGGNNYAWIDSAGYVRALNYASDPGTFTTSGTTTVASATHVLATGPITAQTNAAFTTLKLSGASDVTLASAQTVTVSGLLKADGGSATISGGTGLAPASGAELVIRTDQASDNLTISTPILAAGNNQLTKSGAGTLTLTGTNTFKGPVFINDGTLSVPTIANKGTNSPLGAGNATGGIGGNITIAGGTLQYTGATATSNRAIYVNTGGGGLDLPNASTTLTLNGNVTSNGLGVQNDALIKTGPGGLILSGSTDNSGLLLQVDGGAVQFNKSDGSAVSSVIINNGGSVKLTGSGTDQIYYGGNVTVNSGGTLDFNGKSEDFNGLYGGGTLINTSAASDATVTIGSYGTSIYPTFGGTIVDGATKKIALVSLGYGTQVFTGTNTYTGGTTVRNGTLQIGDGGTTGSIAGNIVLGYDFSPSGTIEFNRSDDVTWGNIISGMGNLVKAGAGTLTLSTANTFTGNTTVTGGILVLGAVNAIPAGTLNLIGGTLNFGSLTAVSFNGISGTSDLALTNNANGAVALTVGDSGMDSVYSGNLTGSGGLVKNGGGTLTLSGTNNYGITTVNTGAVSFLKQASFAGGVSANWTASNLIVAAGATAAFGVGGPGQFTASDITALANLGTASTGFTSGAFLGLDTSSATGGLATVSSGIVNPNGGANALGVTKLGAGTLVLSGANTYSGGTQVLVGTLQIDNDSRLGAASGGLTLQGGALQYGAAFSNLRNITLAGTGGAIDTNGFDVTYSHAITGSGTLQKTGLGALTITGSNGLADGVTIENGTLRVGATGSLPAVAVTLGANSAGATAVLDLNGFNATVSSLTLGAPDSTATSTFNIVTGAGKLTLAGGVVYDATGNPLASTISGNLGLGSSSRTFNVGDSANAATDLTVSANISGSGGLAKSGSGTLLLSGSNTYTGTTNLTSGSGPVVIGSNSALGTGTLSLSGGILQGDGTAHTLTNPVTLAASSTIAGASALGLGLLTNSGNFTLTNNAPSLTLTSANLTNSSTPRTLTLSGTGNTVVTGSIVNGGSGAGSLTKSGNGVLTLNGANTYTGTTTVSAGTLVVGGNTAIGSGALSLNGGTLQGDGTAHTFTNALTLAANSNVAGTSALAFGTLTNSGGNFTLTNDAPSLTLTSANITTSSMARTLTLGGAGNTTVSGAVVNGSTGIGSLAKSGTGTLVLSSTSSTYTGTTNITAGTVSVASLANSSASSSLGSPATGNATIKIGGGANSATLQFTGAAATSNRVIDLAGTTGGATLDASGTGALTLNAAAFTASGGGSKTLTLTGNSSAANTISAAIVNNATTNITSVLKTGTGNWTLTGNNTYTGTTTIASGVLSANKIVVASGNSSLGNATSAVVLGNTTATGALSYTGSTATYLRGFTVNAGGGEFDVTTSGQTLTIGTNGVATAGLFTVGGPGNTQINSAISSTGGLAKTGVGTLTLNGTNTFTGGVTIGGGAVTVTSSATLASTSTPFPLTITAGTLTLNNASLNTALSSFNSSSGSTINFITGATITDNTTANDVLAGALTGGGALVKMGAGALSVSNTTNSYSGGTTVGAGTFYADNGSTGSATGSGAVSINSGGTLGGTGRIAGATTIASGGTLAPGHSPGLLTFDNNLNLNSGSLTLLEIAGTTRGTTHDAINVGGTLAFGGTLTLSLTGGFNPIAGQNFDLFDWTTGATGTFANLNLPSLGSGLSWDASTLYTNGVLSVTVSAIPEPSTYAALIGLGALALAIRRQRGRGITAA